MVARFKHSQSSTGREGHTELRLTDPLPTGSDCADQQEGKGREGQHANSSVNAVARSVRNLFSGGSQDGAQHQLAVQLPSRRHQDRLDKAYCRKAAGSRDCQATFDLPHAPERPSLRRNFHMEAQS